jgi:DHA1 family tetracycline resistance protein-like MFS transporter
MFVRFGLARFPSVFGLSASVEHATFQEILDAAPVAGDYMFFIGLVSALIQGGLIRRLVPRFGELKLIVAGPFLLGLSLFTIGAAPAWWVVLVGCALMPFGFGINNPALNGLLSRSTPAGDQGAVLGLNQSLASLARVAGPLVGGLVFVGFGAGAPFFLSAGVLLLATLLAREYGRRHGASIVAET